MSSQHAPVDPWAKPLAVNDLDLAFGGNMKSLLPPMSAIPEDGIDQSAALRHVGAILGSFAPKHEHKTAACAYLLSKWFDSVELAGGAA